METELIDFEEFDNRSVVAQQVIVVGDTYMYEVIT